MELSSKIYVAGHKGMVGSAIMRELNKKGYYNIIGKSHSELDLTNQNDVDAFFRDVSPDYVFLAAAMVGGISANMMYPADFLMKNLMIQCNIIDSSYRYSVKKLLFLGSSCIYPKEASQPISENLLLTGPLEPTNEGYAIAKIAGLKLCEYYNRQYGANYIGAMPSNLYGYNDNFNVEFSHIIPAMIRKFHEAKMKNLPSVTIWGTGNACRELLFVDDMADACVFLMNNYFGDDFLNIGFGRDYSVLEIANFVKNAVGYKGEINTDPSKPEGMLRKLVDSSKINALGWRPTTTLEKGLSCTYEWFLSNVAEFNTDSH